MNRTRFLERSDGVAFWIMMLLSFAFMVHSYVIAQVVEWFLIFVIIMAGLIFRIVWGMFAWRRPLSVEMEKVERTSFWMIILISLAGLILEYTTTNFFNHYVFYVLVAVLLTKFVVSFFSFMQEKV